MPQREITRRTFIAGGTAAATAAIAGCAAMAGAPGKAAAASSTAPAATKAPARTGKRPNLLFIMTDQQRFDAMGVHGNSVIKTPHLDRLAQSGADLREYFVNASTCIPSRAALFTGRYPHAAHYRFDSRTDINLFRILKNAGYRIGYVGKNHLLANTEFANFDHSDVWGVNHTSSGKDEDAVNAFARARGAIMQEKGCFAGAAFHDFPPELTKPYLEASSAIRFIESSTKDQPFCLCLSIEDPHAPHIAPRKYEKVYPPEKLTLYPTRENEFDAKPRRYKIKWQAQGSDKATEADKRRFMAVYYSMISWVDEQIGRVLDALRARGLEEDTIVVFTSDHGEFCFEHHMCKKDLVMMDSLLHVSLLISWPGHIKPSVIGGTLAEECDVMPTLLELMGIAAPNGVQGTSLVPLLEGRTKEHKTEVFAGECRPGMRNPYPDYESFRADWDKHHLQPGHLLSYTANFNVPGDFTRSVRTRDMKYIWYITGEEELYDLRTDPHEYANLANDPAHATAKCDMRRRLLDWTCTSENTLDARAEAALQAQYPGWTGIPAGAGQQGH